MSSFVLPIELSIGLTLFLFPSTLAVHCEEFSQLSLKGWVRRVVGNIWNVGAGDPGSLPVRNANSGNPVRLTNPLIR